MLRSLLLALDGIADAGAAIDSAIALALEHGAAIDLRLTLDRAAITAPEGGGMVGASMAAHREEVIAGRLQARLREVGQQAGERLAAAGLEGEPQLLDGDVRRLLPQLALGHDLLVLSNAMRRRRDSDDLDIDLALPVEGLVRAVARPLLLVDREPLRPGALLACHDGGRAAATALHLAVLLGLARGREAELLTVGAGEAEEAARQAMAMLDHHGVRGGCRTVDEEGDTADLLCREIEARAPALVVIGAFGERMIREWLFGSTTRTILDRVSPPILIHT